MTVTTTCPQDLVLQELEKRRQSPIDLLELNDGDAEFQYLWRQRNAYVRTVTDVVNCFSDKDPSQIRILEIGAYLGIVSISLKHHGFNVYASELQDFCANPRLQALYKDNGITLSSGDLGTYTLPYEDASFDMVIMCETLEHLNFNPLPALREINRITKPGGQLYIAMPNGAKLFNRLSLLKGQSVHNPIDDYFKQLDTRYNMSVGLHWREYLMQETKEMFTGMGYSVSRAYYFDPKEFDPPRSLKQWFGRWVYRTFPALKHDQVVVGQKINTPDFQYWRTQAGNT